MRRAAPYLEQRLARSMGSEIGFLYAANRGDRSAEKVVPLPASWISEHLVGRAPPASALDLERDLSFVHDCLADADSLKSSIGDARVAEAGVDGTFWC